MFCRVLLPTEPPPSALVAAAQFGKGSQANVTADTYVDTAGSVGSETNYINMGYWADGELTMEHAGELFKEWTSNEGGISPLHIKCAKDNARKMFTDVPFKPFVKARVLDLGVGYGGEAEVFHELHPTAKFVGSDISPGMIEVAKQNYVKYGKDFSAEVLDCTDLSSVEDGAFTHVFAMEMAYHLDRAAHFRETFRVLEPGGWFSATDMIHGPDYPSRWAGFKKEFSKYGLIEAMIFSLYPGAGAAATDWFVVNPETSPELIAKSLEDVGFVDVKVEETTERAVNFNKNVCTLWDTFIPLLTQGGFMFRFHKMKDFNMMRIARSAQVHGFKYVRYQARKPTK